MCKSYSKAIRKYYKTYRPEEYEQHEKNRDWTQNCAISSCAISYWVKNAKTLGYHDKREVNKTKKVIKRQARPQSGPEAIQVYDVTHDEKTLMAQQYAVDKVKVEKTDALEIV